MKKRWKLEDVTEKASTCFLLLKPDGTKSLDNLHAFNEHKKNQKLFLIKSFDNHTFVEKNLEEVVVFEAIIEVSFQEHRKSGDLFKKLSEDKN
ncbi:MAG: hypothetical protein ACK5PQ_00080 [Alphaproteobacteria bacterium]